MELSFDAYFTIIRFLSVTEFLKLTLVNKDFSELIDIPIIWKHFTQRDFPFQSRNLFNTSRNWFESDPLFSLQLKNRYQRLQTNYKLIDSLLKTSFKKRLYHLTSKSHYNLIKAFSVLNINQKTLKLILDEIFDYLDDDSIDNPNYYLNSQLFARSILEIQSSSTNDIPSSLSLLADQLSLYYSDKRSTLNKATINQIKNSNPSIIVWEIFPIIFTTLSNSDSIYSDKYYEMLTEIESNAQYF